MESPVHKLFSPRMRGLKGILSDVVKELGVFPAHAGVEGISLAVTISIGRFPRACGG